MACDFADRASQSIPMRVVDSKTGTSYFQKRRRRFDEILSARELTFSCFQRLPLLNRDRSREWFVEALDSTRKRWPIDLWAWVIMPEHVHLLVAPNEPDVSVGAFQGEIKEYVARRAIKWLESNSPQWIPRLTIREGNRVRRRFWQPGGGYDRNIDNLGTIMKVIDYIHMNPVRRGVVKRAVDWPWSSARWYSDPQSALIEIDRTIPCD